jgi:secondary thiamine-phosphate synthase enzyme
MVRSITIQTNGQGLYDCTRQIAAIVAESGIREGLCTVFVRHTSASLLIQENADPAVRRDLQEWLSRLVPPNDPLYTHTQEGPDDMPSHIKSTLTAASVAVPIWQGELGLGTWQGILLWEHRSRGLQRQLLVHVGI